MNRAMLVEKSHADGQVTIVINAVPQSDDSNNFTILCKRRGWLHASAESETEDRGHPRMIQPNDCYDVCVMVVRVHDVSARVHAPTCKDNKY